MGAARFRPSSPSRRTAPSDGFAGDLFHSGSLTREGTREPRPGADSTSFRQDPRDNAKAGLSPRVFHGAGEDLELDPEVLLRFVRDQRLPVALSDDLLRLSYRHSLRRAEPLPVGEPFEVSFDHFQFVSRRIAAGSRLRLLITSPLSIFLERNYNSGGEVARESAADARPATIRLYHSSERPAVLTLPVVDAAPDP